MDRLYCKYCNKLSPLIKSLATITNPSDTNCDSCAIINIPKHKSLPKLHKIYVPRPGAWEDEEEEDFEVDPDEPPSWHRHFEPDELLNRYLPIREIGTITCLICK